MSSSDTGVSDTLDPMAIVSDDEILSESEVYTSDTTSTDEDDFQPFTQPNFGDNMPLADGPFVGDLPLIQVPAPLPLAAVPIEDLPHDELADDDIDLFIEGPPEGDQDGVALMDDDVPLADVPVAHPVVPVKAPVEEALSDPSGPDLFESVASASLHAPGVQHYSSDSDSDMAMSIAPIVPHDVDPDPEVEFAPAEPVPVGPEPVIAHDPIDIPAGALLLDPLPEPDHVDIPVLAPPIVDAPVAIPPVSDVPIFYAPLPDPVSVFVDRAPFATHVDPRYADTCNGWIEDDDYPSFVVPVKPPVAPAFAPPEVPQYHPHISYVHRTDLPITFLQDIPPPRPGEGPSTQRPDHMPHSTAAFSFMPSFTPAPRTTFPTSAPMGEPFLWSSPNVMPLSDPYHPFHVGYTTDDILISLQLQQDALSRRVQELERTPRPPPCHCQSPFATPPAPLPLPPDSDVRFFTPEQQIAYLLRVIHALEEDWVRLHRLIFFPPPPPPPPASA
ncbi:proline-rich extensin-like protein EPR1 [Helianthus annuus]|uniref:proline-rich extensin-like protein EPR1 n=1 Tax=Helianthus annuus TaxID=4232 RepID=UPI000B904A5B|nr:proline-rich extensin-like protein EPR1 [Helianthus annuus]